MSRILLPLLTQGVLPAIYITQEIATLPTNSPSCKPNMAPLVDVEPSHMRLGISTLAIIVNT